MHTKYASKRVKCTKSYFLYILETVKTLDFWIPLLVSLPRIRKDHILTKKTFGREFKGSRIIFFICRTYLSKQSCIIMFFLYFAYSSLKKGFLYALHRKLALLVSFCVREVIFPALVRYNFKCAENQLSVRKMTSTWLTFDIQRTKNIVRITCKTYFNAFLR